MKDFRKLRVWRDSHNLTLKIYKISKNFPNNELFSLTSQMRRSSASIATNIAEGCGRDGDRELARFLQIAMGSSYELDYQLMLSRDLGYVNPSTYVEINDSIDKVKRQLALFLKRLRSE
ncbi:MAG: four helix bundle protein [Pyrinomonadaceae bacterium]